MNDLPRRGPQPGERPVSALDRAEESGRTQPQVPGRESFDLCGCAITARGVGAAAGFYLWMLRRPEASLHISLSTVPLGMFNRLAPALAGGIGAGIIAALLLTAFGSTRGLRGRLALAAGGLYLASFFSLLGATALIAAPAAAAAGLIALRRREIRLDGTLLALHAAGLGTAICLFHQLPQYGPGWAPFVADLKALVSIWL